MVQEADLPRQRLDLEPAFEQSLRHSLAGNVTAHDKEIAKDRERS
jgi:hypothetical protein